VRSSAPGKRTSSAEVQDITPHGVWLLAKGREYFLSYGLYPWFKKATVAAAYNVELLHDMHLHWPDLDVDLELESLEAPEKYPLAYK
jgi:hypothetical protein